MSKIVDEYWMSVALEAANKASSLGEVPVGCVITHPTAGYVIAHNLCESTKVGTQHAEMVAIEKMSLLLNNYRLNECSLYVTLEPCVQCCGAIILSRIKTVVFGAFEPKTGGARSLYNLLDFGALNHKCQVKGGLLQNQSAQLLKSFFIHKRIQSKGL